MRTREQVRWDFVQQWLTKAESDLRVARALLQAEFDDYENVGFHAQQAAEKFIKATLVRHQVEFPKTHDIARLRDLLARVEPTAADRIASANVLTPYGVEFRYPSDLPPLSRTQGAETLRLAEEVRGTIMAAMRQYLDAGRPPGDEPSAGA